MTKGSLAKIALFLAGLFAGGVLDHGLLAWQGSETTSYGLHVGIGGNWLFMILDGTIATALFLLHRRFERTGHRASQASATP